MSAGTSKKKDSETLPHSQQRNYGVIMWIALALITLLCVFLGFMQINEIKAAISATRSYALNSTVSQKQMLANQLMQMSQKISILEQRVNKNEETVGKSEILSKQHRELISNLADFTKQRLAYAKDQVKQKFSQIGQKITSQENRKQVEQIAAAVAQKGKVLKQKISQGLVEGKKVVSQKLSEGTKVISQKLSQGKKKMTKLWNQLFE